MIAGNDGGDVVGCGCECIMGDDVDDGGVMVRDGRQPVISSQNLDNISRRSAINTRKRWWRMNGQRDRSASDDS